MAKQSFADATSVAEPEPTPAAAVAETPTPAPETSPVSEPAAAPTSTAVVTHSPASQSPATRSGATEDGQLEGNVDRTDMKLPRVNLAQKAGKLGDKFAPGSFVLSKTVRLSDGKTPFHFIALTVKKQYQEDLPYDPDADMPPVYDSIEEVRAAGGSLKYGDDRYFKKIATALMLVEAPEGTPPDTIEEQFIYECDGKHYAAALITLAGSSYTSAATKLFTARTIGHLKDGFEKGRWAATSEHHSTSSFSWHTVELAPAGKNSEALQAFAKGFLG